MSNSVVSVIVPIYNTAEYLQPCLDSLLGQSYRELEIICVNDGSSDNSSEILEEYAARDSRIKVIHQENAGVAAARNQGLDEATGEYVTFVDSDDWLESEAYEKVIEQFTAGVDIVAMGAVLDGEVAGKDGLEEYFNRLPQGKIEVTPAAFAELNISLPTKVYRRSVIEEKVIRFPVGIAYGEDTAFVCCVLPWSGCMYNLGSRYYHYVQHESSAMQNPMRLQRNGEDLLKAWDYVKFQYERWGIVEKFWPICERWLTDFCLFMKPSEMPVSLRDRVWKLAQDCGLQSRSRHPAMNMMRVYYMPGWEKKIHWYKANCECFGLAGKSIWSITYTRKEEVHRFMGIEVYRKVIHV